MIFRYATLSLVVLASTLHGANNRLYQEGLVLGRALCSDRTTRLSDRLPHTINTFKKLFSEKPSSRAGKQAFADLKQIGRGVEQAARQSYVLKAMIARQIGQLISESRNLSQLFSKLGTAVKYLEFHFAPNDGPLPSVRLDNRSPLYALGKDAAGELADIVVGLARTGYYEDYMEKLNLGYVRFIVNFYKDGYITSRAAFYTGVFNAMAGFKKGLQEYPLKRKSSGISSVNAIFVRLLIKQLTNLASMVDEVRKGNDPRLTEISNAFIACGKELERLG